jgi:hypothetical protein
LKLAIGGSKSIDAYTVGSMLHFDNAKKATLLRGECRCNERVCVDAVALSLTMPKRRRGCAENVIAMNASALML